MSNDQPNDKALVPAPLNPAEVDVAALRARTRAEKAAGVNDTPNFGGGVLWTKTLADSPFVFMSPGTITFEDGKFGLQETFTCWVSRLDEEGGLQAPQQARLQGTYLLNQLRNATVRELVGSKIFVITRTTGQVSKLTGIGEFAYEREGRVEYPYMLHRWDGEPVTVSETDEVPFKASDTPKSKAGKSAARRIAEIEAAGGPVPPDYWTQGAGKRGK